MFGIRNLPLTVQQQHDLGSVDRQHKTGSGQLPITPVHNAFNLLSLVSQSEMNHSGGAMVRETHRQSDEQIGVVLARVTLPLPPFD